MRLPRMEFLSKTCSTNKYFCYCMKDREILKQYLPEPAVDPVLEQIKKHNIFFKISKSRNSKLGDYRPPIRSSVHRISVNHDLNPYSFLITFVHEVAHLVVFEKFGNKVSPHGKEWKTAYWELMQPYLENGSFPEDIKNVLQKSLKNSKASSTSDIKLSRVLKKYNKPTNEIHVEELETGSIFQIKNGRAFKKGERVRTRYKCLNLQNNRLYLFHPLTPVVPVE